MNLFNFQVDHLLSTLCNEAADYSANFISIVLSLLSNLCRGSAAVTEQVLRSEILFKTSLMKITICNKELDFKRCHFSFV